MPKRILIVDDNEDIRRVIRWFLESRTACEVCGEAVDGVARSTGNFVHEPRYQGDRTCSGFCRHTGSRTEN
jgi:CheY-like chemotaxis protein